MADLDKSYGHDSEKVKSNIVVVIWNLFIFEKEFNNAEEIALKPPGSDSKRLFEIHELTAVGFRLQDPCESRSSFPCYQVIWTNYITSELENVRKDL